MAAQAKKPTTKKVKRANGYTRVAVDKERRSDANKAIAYLRGEHEKGTTKCHHNFPWQGHCAHVVACAYGSKSGANESPGGGAYSGWNAFEGWLATAEKYRRDGRNMDDPPRGALCFWKGGKYGHVAISNGRGKIWGNDAPTNARIGLVPLPWFASHWGYTYVGWVWPDEVAGW